MKCCNIQAISAADWQCSDKWTNEKNKKQMVAMARSVLGELVYIHPIFQNRIPISDLTLSMPDGFELAVSCKADGAPWTP